MSKALLFLALSLASFRVWRFLGRDDITAPLWSRIPGKLGDGWRCGHCFGTWLALGSTYLVHRYLVALEPHWLLWAVAVAGGVGFLADIDGRLNRD